VLTPWQKPVLICCINNKPLVEDNGKDDEDNKFDEGNIPNNDDEYAVGLMVPMSLSTRRTTSMKLSALPPRERALRVSGRACPHAESIILSAGGAESMLLSSCAESIILSVLPTESMILSQCHPHASVP
jgi:hypothetical protein